WGGIGMATRGSVPTIMRMAGVDLLPPEAGAAWIRRELMSHGRRGEVVEAGVLDGLVVRTRLDPKVQPFLDDHRIDGTAVLPGVMGMEAFAEVARLLVPQW